VVEQEAYVDNMGANVVTGLPADGEVNDVMRSMDSVRAIVRALRMNTRQIELKDRHQPGPTLRAPTGRRTTGRIAERSGRPDGDTSELGVGRGAAARRSGARFATIFDGGQAAGADRTHAGGRKSPPRCAADDSVATDRGDGQVLHVRPPSAREPHGSVAHHGGDQHHEPADDGRRRRSVSWSFSLVAE